jgi:hypothetical protein
VTNQPRYSVKECLRGYTNEALGILCSEWTLAASSKESRIRALEKVLQDPLHLQRAAADLNAESRRTLELVQAQGSAWYADLLNVPGIIGDGRTRESVDALARRGFLLISPKNGRGEFTFNDLSLNGHAPNTGPAMVIPATLRGFIDRAPCIKVSIAPQSGETLSPRARGPVSMVLAMLETLRAIDLVEPRVTGAGSLHKSDRARLGTLTKEAGVSAEALNLCLMMAREAGLVTIAGRRLAATRTSLEWAQANALEQSRTLFDAFVRSDELPDLKLFYADLFETMEEAMPLGTLRRSYHRRLAREALRGLESGQWYRVDDFTAAIRRLDENVFFLNEQWRALKSNAGEGSTAWRQRAWQSYDARYFAWFAKSTLEKFGMADVSEDDAHFRLTPLGAAVLGVDETADPEPDAQSGDGRAPLIVQADFEVLAYTDRCSPWVRRVLDLFGERTQAGAVNTYKITPESIFNGEQAGIGLDTFLDVLDRNSAHGIPGNVREEFSSWLRKLDSVTLQRGCTVLEFASAEAAAAFAAERDDAQRIGDYFVKVSSYANNGAAAIDYGQPLPPCLREGEGLTFEVSWDRVNLFVRRRLAGIGSVRVGKDGGLTLEITSGDARPDLDWGLVFAELEALSERPIPGRYRTALRAWSGDIGPALTRTATLIRFDEREVCDTALEIADIAEQVEGRLGPRTLVVKDGCLNALKRAIKQHGVRVTRSSDTFDDGSPETWNPQTETVEEAEAPTRAKRKESNGNAPVDDGITLPSYTPRVVCEIIDDAIRHRHPVLIRYQPAWGNGAAVRQINPVAIDLNGASPTVHAYCPEQDGTRAFRLSRIDGVRILEDETF